MLSSVAESSQLQVFQDRVVLNDRNGHTSQSDKFMIEIYQVFSEKPVSDLASKHGPHGFNDCG